jgi:hypothetical protein
VTRQGLARTRTSQIAGFLALQRSTVGVLAMAVVALVLRQRLIEGDASGYPSTQDAGDLRAERNPLKLLGMMNPAMQRLLVTEYSSASVSRFGRPSFSGLSAPSAWRFSAAMAGCQGPPKEGHDE